MTKDWLTTFRGFAALLATAAPVLFAGQARAAAGDPAEAAPGEAISVRVPEGVRVPGQLSQMFKLDDANPEGNVPTPRQRLDNPLEFGYYLQDVLARAEDATKRNDLARATRYYRALAAALPEQAQGWSLLCATYEKAHDRERALRACRYALDRQGVELKDYRRYIDLTLAKPDALTGDEKGALETVLAHLDKQPDLLTETAHLRCRVAIKTKDAAALEACTAVLAKAAPDDPKTVVFQWSLAVMRGDRAAAARLLDRAQQLGVASENIERMSRVAIPGRWTSSRGLGVAAVGAAAILFALLLVALRRRLAAPRGLAP